MGINKDTGNLLQEAALAYADKYKLSIIPINHDKKPFFKWYAYQNKKATAEEIRQWWHKWPNAMIGIVTGQISNLFVVDCDTQEGFDSIQKLLPDSLEIPMARTPRGGWHFFFEYPADSKLTCKAGILPGVDIRGKGGYIVAAPSKNGNGKAYQWFDGLSLAEVTPPPMPGVLLSTLINNINNSIYRGCCLDKQQNNNIRQHKTTLTTKTTELFVFGNRDESLFHTANCLVKGGMPENEIRQVLEKLILSWGENPDRKWIDTKINSALARADNRERNLTAEIREWILAGQGNFKTTDLQHEITLNNKDNIKKANAILSRFCQGDNPLIERYGDKRGCYRRIENNLEEMDFINAPTDEFPLALPLDIDSYSILYPGNIVVVAGSKSAGKTAFLLNIVKDNMNKYEIVYFNSEMGETELKKRLELFGLPLDKWKFKVYPRAENFADLITPEKKVFIIDFLEVTEDFWKVSKFIKDIHGKLKEGICIIALQKSEGKASGRGGDFSKEKARLYINLDYLPERKVNQITIAEAKAWRTEINPRGMFREYKLVNGSKFVKTSDWQ